MNVRVYGDLETDADFLGSIQRWGIIDPIVYQPLSFDGGVTFENVIVSGHRRFLAARTFKFAEVPVRLAMPDRLIVDETDLLDIERLVLETNKQRVKSRTQLGREFIELRRIEARSAELRQKAGTCGKDFPKGQVGRARDIAAKTLGVSGRTAEKISKIIEKADTGDLQAKQVLVDLNDKRISISAGYLKALNIRHEEEDPRGNRSLKRQEFIRLHPEFGSKSNKEIDTVMGNQSNLHGGPSTPEEKERERIGKLKCDGVSITGRSFNKSTGKYSVFAVGVSNFPCFRNEETAVRFSSAFRDLLGRFESETIDGRAIV